MILRLDQIRMDGGTQPRAAMDDAVVAEYAQAMLDGAVFPPVVVFHDGRDYWLADGFQRCCAADKAEHSVIEADVQQGTQRDAQWYSYGANKDHGLRRTNDDKRRAVEAALAHPKAKGMSDAAIAEHCGVARETILRYRKSKPTCDNITSRTGRDGRTINTSNIGRTRQQEVIDNRTGEVLPDATVSTTTTTTKRIVTKEEYEAEAEAEAAAPAGPRGMGIEYAHKAIAILRSIPANDPLRGDGFGVVERWIRDNR
jgi:hypothetical protein